MRQLVVLSFISLDGVMQAPGGPEEDASNDFRLGGWTVPYSDEQSEQLMNEQMSMPFDLLLGRKTYDIFAGYWPNHPEIEAVATPFNTAKKYVVSHANIDLPWSGSVLISGNDVVSQFQRLKSEDGPMLQVHGSGDLIQTLLQNDLVDELWLKIFPVTLGNGKKLFAEGTRPAAFELTQSKTTGHGVIFANYKRAGDVQTGSFA